MNTIILVQIFFLDALPSKPKISQPEANISNAFPDLYTFTTQITP